MRLTVSHTGNAFIRGVVLTVLIVSAQLLLNADVSGQDAVYRLMNRASENPLTADRVETIEAEGIPVLSVPGDDSFSVQAAWQELDSSGAESFANRDGTYIDPNDVFLPQTIRREMFRQGKRPQLPRGSRREELVFDGYDRGQAVSVDESFSVYGLDTEDTIAHFDTLDGRRLVSPSNRVAIYAPRFGTVRQVSDFGFSEITMRTGDILDRQQMMTADGNDTNRTASQYEQTRLNVGGVRPSILEEQTRAVPNEHVTRIFGVTSGFEAFENLSVMRFGRFSSAEFARLNMGLQSANVWQDNLGLQVSANNITPIIVNDLSRVQLLEIVDTKGDNAILRVLKLASQLAARPGDTVEFSIRFDNLSPQKIGNVTIIDNLTSRLEYVPGSAECSLNADFMVKENEAGSLQLRWEIRDPVARSSGGLIRFKCKVR